MEGFWNAASAAGSVPALAQLEVEGQRYFEGTHVPVDGTSSPPVQATFRSCPRCIAHCHTPPTQPPGWFQSCRGCGAWTGEIMYTVDGAEVPICRRCQAKSRGSSAGSEQGSRGMSPASTNPGVGIVPPVPLRALAQPELDYLDEGPVALTLRHASSPHSHRCVNLEGPQSDSKDTSQRTSTDNTTSGYMVTSHSGDEGWRTPNAAQSCPATAEIGAKRVATLDGSVPSPAWNRRRKRSFMSESHSADAIVPE